MKIEPGHTNPAEIGAGAGTSADRLTERLRQEPAVGSGDQVELSALSNFVQNAELESPARTQRIGQLAEAVAAGTFQADSLEIGQSIIDEAVEGIL